jgi:putative ABC transport system permease protein
VTSLRAVAADQRLARSLTTDLVGGFAALSLLLACVGLHGLLTLVVTGRRKEIGVRLALGAPRSTVAGLVIRESLRPMFLGLLLGLLLSQPASAGVRTLLVGVSPLDPLALTMVTVFMVAVGVTAAVLPARKAARVDPAVTLRN